MSPGLNMEETQVRPQQQLNVEVWFKRFLRDFLLAWGIRGGISFIPLLFNLIKARKWLLLQILKQSFGESAIRFGGAISLYFTLLRLLEGEAVQQWLLANLKVDREKIQVLHSFLSGAIASVALWILPPSFRWAWAPYLAVRAAQCIYEQYKAKSPFLQRWATKWLDLLLFTLTSAQVLYSFTVRPEVLDPGYMRFLMGVCVIDPRTVQAANNFYKGAVSTNDFDQLERMMKQHGLSLPLDLALRQQPYCIGCEVIHPGYSCFQKWMVAYLQVFRFAGPIYLANHLLPPLLFKFFNFLQRPTVVLKHSLWNTLRSTTFMAAYVQLFQIAFCLHRAALKHESWLIQERSYWYWIFGAISGLSLLVEAKHRRTELTLFVSCDSVDTCRCCPKHSPLFIEFWCKRVGQLMYRVGICFFWLPPWEPSL